MALPRYEDVALGTLGRFADSTAIVRLDGDELSIVRIAPHVAVWLHGAADGQSPRERSDCTRVLRQVVHRALQTGRPAQEAASRVENGVVEVHQILVLPLETHWGFPVALVHVGEPESRSSLVEQVYHSTTEGILALIPVRDVDGALQDLQIVALNAGAATLMRQPASALLWQHLSAIRLGSRAEDIVTRLHAVVETGGRIDFELDYVVDQRELFLKVAASTLGDLLVITLVDITELRTARRHSG